MTALPAAAEMGPLWKTAPGWSAATGWERTDGDLAARVASDLGFDLDVDQRWSLDAIFAEDDDGLPACGEFCVVGGRQVVGKSVTLMVAAVMDVLYLGHPVHIWTAHQFKTARKTFEDLRARLQRNPDYAERISGVSESHGDEAIWFDDDSAAIEFHARSGRSGRGFTTGRITMDEAMYVQPGDLGALVPTLVTIDDAQVRYGASGGMLQSAHLRALRDRGRSGTDSSLAYIEHGAPFRRCRDGNLCHHQLDDPGCALNDQELWRWCAPGLRAGRVTLKSMLGQRQKLASSPREFCREFYTWWEDPPNDAGGALDINRWKTLADRGERGAPFVFAVATPRDRSWCAIAVAWRRPDGLRQVQLVDDGYRPGTAWVPDRIAELRRRWDGGRVLVDTNARGLLPDDVAEEPGEADQAEAHNALANAIEAGTVRHGNEPAMNTAIRAARWKDRGATRALDRDGDVDVSPAAAAAMALHALASEAGPSAYEDGELLVV